MSNFDGEGSSASVGIGYDEVKQGRPFQRHTSTASLRQDTTTSKSSSSSSTQPSSRAKPASSKMSRKDLACSSTSDTGSYTSATNHKKSSSSPPSKIAEVRQRHHELKEAEAEYTCLQARVSSLQRQEITSQKRIGLAESLQKKIEDGKSFKEQQLEREENLSLQKKQDLYNKQLQASLTEAHLNAKKKETEMQMRQQINELAQQRREERLALEHSRKQQLQSEQLKKQERVREQKYESFGKTEKVISNVLKHKKEEASQTRQMERDITNLTIQRHVESIHQHQHQASLIKYQHQLIPQSTLKVAEYKSSLGSNKLYNVLNDEEKRLEEIKNKINSIKLIEQRSWNKVSETKSNEAHQMEQLQSRVNQASLPLRLSPKKISAASSVDGSRALPPSHARGSEKRTLVSSTAGVSSRR